MPDTITYRIVHRMKVTALIPDQLIQEVSRAAGGKTLTESLITALKEWLALQKMVRLNTQVRKKPLQFQDGFSAAKVRSLNRQL